VFVRISGGEWIVCGAVWLNRLWYIIIIIIGRHTFRFLHLSLYCVMTCVWEWWGCW